MCVKIYILIQFLISLDFKLIVNYTKNVFIYCRTMYAYTNAQLYVDLMRFSV